MYEPVNKPSYTNTNLPYYSSSLQPIQPPPPSIPHYQYDYSLPHQPHVASSSSSLGQYANYGPYTPAVPPHDINNNNSYNYASPNVESSSAPPPYYSDPTWVVKQAAPIKYSSPIQPVRTEPVASTSHGISLNRNLVGLTSTKRLFKSKPKLPKKILKKTSASQSVWCKLCKIECNSIQHYEKHLAGKKHNQSIKKTYALNTVASAGKASQLSSSGGSLTGTDTLGAQGVVGGSSVPIDLEAKKQKLLEGGTAVQSLKVCTICNVACNGEIAFADHIVGKKHGIQERALKRTNLERISASNPETKSQENIVNKTNNVVLAWCDVCKISCTSAGGLGIHRQGKKHQKNLEKLRDSISSSTPSASTSAALPITNPLTGVVKDVESAKGSVVKDAESAKGPISEPKQLKKKARQKDSEDLESKKQKVLVGGAAADAVRTCLICNVVCNSVTVFNSHLAGQKHAAMLKQAGAGQAANSQSVTAAI